MFPEIKTRRLGVRGQSKYHYCGIRLFGEPNSPRDMKSASRGRSGSTSAQSAGDTSIPEQPTTLPLAEPVQRFYGHRPSVHDSSSLLFDESSEAYRITRPLCFLAAHDELLAPAGVSLSIPEIDPFLPAGTDSDTAAALMALYRSHCASLVEAMRYMRLKQFFHLFVSFHGNLTVPVQKLLSVSDLAPWIREADGRMYRVGVHIHSSHTLLIS